MCGPSHTAKDSEEEPVPMRKPITIYLWYDREAREATKFYTSIFQDSAIDHVVRLPDTPSGEAELVSFHIGDQPFMAISAGPLFRFNPAISIMVNFAPSRDPRAREHLDAAWAALTEGGKVLMPLDAYPFSPHYGWVEDRYGLSWQLILTNPEGEPRPYVLPYLLFTGAVHGKAEEAGEFYRSVFPGSRPGRIVRHPPGQQYEREGTVLFSDFRLGEQTWFVAMDSGYPHGFSFNESISFMVECRDQAEIDRYWEKLSAVPGAERCGWCKDRFGISWQIVPESLGQMMRDGSPEQIARLTQAMFPMKKLDLAELERAFHGK